MFDLGSTNMQISSTLLAEIACAIAVAAGLPADSVSLYENDDGSFTATVCGREHTGSLRDVLAWAALEAKDEVARDLAKDGQPDWPGMSL